MANTLLAKVLCPFLLSPKFVIVNHPYSLSLSPPQGTDACHGDSGGPLTVDENGEKIFSGNDLDFVLNNFSTTAKTRPSSLFQASLS